MSQNIGHLSNGVTTLDYFQAVLTRFAESFPWGERHKQILMIFLSMVLAYALRVNLSVGIVAMTDRSSANHRFVVSDIVSSNLYTIVSQRYIQGG